MRLIAASLVIYFFAFCTPIFSQSISINNTGNPPDQSAILDIQSNDKGMLIPRMDSLQRVGINPVATGLLVYDTDSKGFWYHDGLVWIELVSKNIGSLKDKDGDTQIQLEKSPNDNNIRFDVEGDEVMVIDETGEVEIRSRSINAPGFLSLNNIDTTNFLRLFSGHQNDFDPFLLRKTGSALRFITANKDYQDWTEQMRISGNGDLTVTGKVGIGTSTPDPSSALDVNSATMGFLPPRMTSVQRDAIPNPAEGLTIYNTSTHCLEFYRIAGWQNNCNSTIPLNSLIGGSGGDFALTIQQTADGGYIVGGYSFSSASGDVSGTSNGGADYWIVKLNSNGGIVWDKLIGGSGDDVAFSIQQTADGGYIAGGYSTSSASGDVSGTSYGGVDYWIVKLNSNGGIVWDKLIGGSGNDYAYSIQQTADGGYIVGGFSTSSASGDVSGTSNGGNDYWIVKLNSNGGIVWETLIGGSGSDHVRAIQQTADGCYIVAGFSKSSASGDVSGTSNGGNDYWIVKLNSNGGIVWDKLIGGSGSEISYSIQQTAEGGYIVTGESTSSASGDVSGPSNGASDYWIVKLNSNGGIVWDKLIGGIVNDRAYSIQQTADGGYIVGGYSVSSASGDVSGTSNGESDSWIVKLNSSGGIVWDTLIGGSGYDYAYSIQKTAEGGYIVAGHSTSSASGDVSGTSNGGVDYWIVTLESNGSIIN